LQTYCRAAGWRWKSFGFLSLRSIRTFPPVPDGGVFFGVAATATVAIAIAADDARVRGTIKSNWRRGNNPHRFIHRRTPTQVRAAHSKWVQHCRGRATRACPVGSAFALACPASGRCHSMPSSPWGQPPCRGLGLAWCYGRGVQQRQKRLL
jgi:hypothetical protein